MANAVIVPKLDEDMVTGKIAQWHKKEGERVEKGDVVVSIETAKVTFEVEAEAAGIMSRLLADEGDELAVGTVIAYILQPGEQVPEITEPIEPVKEKEAPASTQPSPTATGKVSGPPAGGTVKASPVAKRMAKEHNIDLSTIAGTGPGGRIVKEDVLQAVDASKAIPTQTIEAVPEEVEQITPLSSMRQIIATRMTESFQTPHFYLNIEVDTSEFSRTLQQLQSVIEKKTGTKITVTDLLIRMVAKSLEDNPGVNCSYVDGGVKYYNHSNIGLVVSVEGGLVVPVIREADRKSLAEIVQARADLVQRARDRKLGMAEMKGSTFTLSNLGMFGIDHFSAILQPPEAAILAVGRIAEKAVVKDGQVVARPMMVMTMSIDHRVLDGALGAQFLQSLKNYIENPMELLCDVT